MNPVSHIADVSPLPFPLGRCPHQPINHFLPGKGIYFSFHLRTFSKVGIIYMSSSCTFQCEF